MVILIGTRRVFSLYLLVITVDNFVQNLYTMNNILIILLLYPEIHAFVHIGIYLLYSLLVHSNRYFKTILFVVLTVVSQSSYRSVVFLLARLGYDNFL